MTDTTKRWTLVHSSGGPTARSGHCIAVIKDEVFVFGGCGHPANSSKSPAAPTERPDDAEVEEGGDDMDPRCLGDLHVYNAVRQRWSEVQLPASKLRPAQRTCAAICASQEEENRLFLSGGAGDDPYDLRGDLLEYDVRERSWSVLFDDATTTAGAGPEVCPFRRIGHTMVHHPGSNRLVLFGGSTGLEYFNDTHAFDLATGSWTMLATVGDRPSPRYKHQAFIDADYMYVVGGGSFEPEGPGLDVYRLSLAVGGGSGKPLEWERLTPTGTPPPCRAAHGLAWDSVGKVAYIWGGFTSGMELDSTFCALRLSSPASHPPPTTRSTAASVASEATLGVVAAATSAPEVSGTAVRPLSTETPFNGRVAIEVGELGGNLNGSSEALASRYGNRMTTWVRSRGRALSADAAGVMAESAARSKPSDSSSDSWRQGQDCRSSAPSIESLELWREQNDQHALQQQHPEEQHSPLLSRADSPRNPSRGVNGRERWRRRGQRFWRQGSGRERGGGIEDPSSSGSSRRSRVGRNRSWTQGWTTGRLQGLWGGGSGGGGSGGGGGEIDAESTNHAPPALGPVVGWGTLGAVPTPRPIAPHSTSSRNAVGAAAAPALVVGEELSWLTLPPGGQTGTAACAGVGDDLTLAPAPAGRSFHCTFFHGGSIYVTGGSDGARKFGDMWRFPARETPPPLTTLAARALVSWKGAGSFAVSGEEAARKIGGIRGDKDGGSGGGDGDLARAQLQGLPGELREALDNLNMQAEVVF